MEWKADVRRRLRRVAVCVGVASGFICLAELNDRSAPPLDHPAIRYRSLPGNDPVGLLNVKLRAGSAHLNFEGPQGYLRSVLRELEVPVASQVAVFSKTSQQADRISPQNPRTIFFNDALSVAWMYGGFIEVASHDPRQGVIFYTLAQLETETPQFQRHDDCVRCHVSDVSLGVPGMMVRSIFTAPDGRPRLIMGGFLIDHRSPMGDRWGGYYVTGATAAVRHLGNALATDEEDPLSMVTPETLEVGSLKRKFDTDHYLSPYSEVGALMVFDHQMYMTNLITRAGWEARAASYDAAHGQHVDSGKILRESAEELVDYLLFLDEPRLARPIQSAAAVQASAFVKAFTAQGPFDRKGRSLRELDLQTRVLRYPCSYMIYSAAFNALPDTMKTAIYARLRQVLSGKAAGDKARRLSLADRQSIIEILRDTKPDLAAYLQPVQ